MGKNSSNFGEFMTMQLEECGWALSYNITGDNRISIGDNVPGGARGNITISRSEIKTIVALLRKFEKLYDLEQKEIKDSELFEDNIPLEEQVKSRSK
jgi:hypothetical protein